MSIDDSRPDAAQDSARPRSEDPFLEKLRDLPRMRPDASAGSKPFRPPAPTLSRIGAFTQGCSGLLVVVLALPMLLSAVLYGFYVWGPGMLLTGGILLLAAVLGIWRGARLSLAVSLLVTIGVALLMYQWRYFVFAAAALSPFGQITDLIYNMGLMIGAMALLVTLVVHIISLFAWRRLYSPSAQWQIAAWIVGLVVAIALPLMVHYTTQRQREQELQQERDNWLAEAATDQLIMGANGGVALGYSFAYNSADTSTAEDNFSVRLAELNASLDTGASPIRVTASGDTLLEAEEPLVFRPIGENNEASEPDPAYSAERLKEQLEREERYMNRIAESGAALLISDSQYSPYLLTRANQEDAEPLPWDEFTALHVERVRHYARTYRPAAYGVVTEPSAYETYSAIELPSDDEDENLDAWIAHTEELAAAVRDEVPDALIGVTISLDNEFELDYYERVLELDAVDFISIDVFQQAAFTRIEEILDERGHPADHAKALWITETWYGFCMAPQRSMELDALWLETVTAFAAKENLAAVMPTSFGCFLQPGGTLLLPNVDENGRTEAFEVWQRLVETWQAPLEGADNADNNVDNNTDNTADNGEDEAGEG